MNAENSPTPPRNGSAFRTACAGPTIPSPPAARRATTPPNRTQPRRRSTGAAPGGRRPPATPACRRNETARRTTTPWWISATTTSPPTDRQPDGNSPTVRRAAPTDTYLSPTHLLSAEMLTAVGPNLMSVLTVGGSSGAGRDDRRLHALGVVMHAEAASDPRNAQRLVARHERTLRRTRHVTHRFREQTRPPRGGATARHGTATRSRAVKTVATVTGPAASSVPYPCALCLHLGEGSAQPALATRAGIGPLTSTCRRALTTTCRTHCHLAVAQQIHQKHPKQYLSLKNTHTTTQDRNTERSTIKIN